MNTTHSLPRNVPPDATALLDDLVRRLREVLGDALIGVYTRGSLAMGDFISDTSDLDVLVALAEPPDDALFDVLLALHDEVARSGSPFADRLEVAYIDVDALRRLAPGQHFPTLGQGETLHWTEHGANWAIERWTAREHGIALLGPPPATLIDPVPADVLVEANRERLAAWNAWIDEDHAQDDDWQHPRRGHMAYVVETMCRCLFALEHGRIATKPEAVRWALATWTSPWRETVERSRAWRLERWTVDAAIAPEVRALVRWAASRR